MVLRCSLGGMGWQAALPSADSDSSGFGGAQATRNGKPLIDLIIHEGYIDADEQFQRVSSARCCFVLFCFVCVCVCVRGMFGNKGCARNFNFLLLIF